MVDWNRVNDLRREVGEENFDEIIAMFLEETDAVIHRLSWQTSAKVLENDLHFLKGSALNIGLATLAGLCQLGEKQAALGDTDIDLSRIAKVYQLSRAELLGALKNDRAA